MRHGGSKRGSKPGETSVMELINLILGEKNQFKYYTLPKNGTNIGRCEINCSFAFLSLFDYI